MHNTYLENLSTKTRMESKPLWVRGSLTIRSIDTESHRRFGIGRGCSRPAFLRVDDLLVWQLGQDSTYSSTSLRNSGHQYCLATNSNVLCLPRWSAQGGSWCSLSILVLN